MCFYEFISTFNCPKYTTDRLVKNNIGLFQLLFAPPVEEPWNFQGRGALTLEFPGERCINFKFPGEEYINLGISRGEGTLTLKFPGKGAFML
jgi:hypothetical protein